MKVLGVFEKLNSIIKLVDNILGHIAGFCILIITGIVCYEVFFRYVLNKPPIWAFDVCSYLLLLIAVFSGVYTMEQDGHVRFTVVVESFKPKLRAVFVAIGSVFGLTYCFVLLRESIVLGWLAVERNIYTFAQIRIPDVYLYLIIVLGAFLLFCTFLIKTIVELCYTTKKD